MADNTTTEGMGGKFQHGKQQKRRHVPITRIMQSLSISRQEDEFLAN